MNNVKTKRKEIISGWGLYPKIKAKINRPRSLSELRDSLKVSSLIARGNGRSYGDSSINETNTIDMRHFNRFLHFDEKSGLLIAQAGVLLEDVINTFLPKGWFLNVSPGTKFVTLGGMVAADVHGKNHHVDGSFGNFIDWIEIINKDGQIVRCSRKENSDLFFWTIGGMGLTGIIMNVAFFLKPVETGLIKQKTLVARNISHAIELFERNLNSQYLVAWIDCYSKGKNLGRSLIMLGEHAKKREIFSGLKLNPLKISIKRRISIPFYFPSFVLSKFSVKIFNYFFYLKGKFSKTKRIIDWDTYFYPLDKILNWNKIYGSKGFAQFQCVIPLENSKKGITDLLECISKSKSSSFLAVLKRFGPQNSNFSFPMEGYSLALDFPINDKNLLLMNSLDELTIKYGGRFYLVKDSRMKKETFMHSDNRIENFKVFRNNNLNSNFQSAQSNRLDL